VHAGTRYSELFNDIKNQQYYCLLGAEGYKLDKSLQKLDISNIKCIIEPTPRKMGTILPDSIINNTYELSSITFIENYPDSLLTIAFQLCIDLNAEEVYLFGLDGYDEKTDEQMIEVAHENQLIIDAFNNSGIEPISLTPSNYKGFKTISIYSKL
jgi:4-hydroxy 2-oxovalerate aldolase